MHLRLLAATALTFSILSLTTSQADAAGFYIQEQSVKGLGSAFSGSTTSIDDASTLYFNPAGMTKLDGMQANAGINLLIPDAEIENNGSTFDFNGPAPGGIGPIAGPNSKNPYSATPVPNLFFVAPVNNQFWAGIGVTAPFGLGSEYDDNSFSRFDSTDTELKTINIQPSIAFKATEYLSIGGGIDIQYADATLRTAVSNIASEGISTLKGDDVSYGYNIGLLFTPRPDTEVGLHYRSAISHTLDGRISVEGLNAGNFDVSGSADLDLPDIATLGIAHDINDKFRMMGQATWFGWNNFESIAAKRDDGVAVTPIQQGYQNTFAVAVGGEYDLNMDWTLRAGYQFDETPTTNEFRTTRTPDGDRNWITAGATYKLNDKIDLDFAAAYIIVDEGTIDVTRNSGLANVKANTDGDVKIISVGLNYKF